jgi:hypothetical protein
MGIHQPATPAEKDLVDQMVAARWRILRLQAIESDLLDTRMRQKKESERKFPSGRIVRLSDAYTSEVNDSRAMALASRCEARFNRMYQSSYRVLRELQAARMKQSSEPAAPESTQPEPAAKAQSAEKIFDNKPKAAIISNAPDAFQASNAGKTDAETGGAGDPLAKNRESDASLGWETYKQSVVAAANSTPRRLVVPGTSEIRNPLLGRMSAARIFYH